ncbi:ATP-dependent DNA ligase [Streptomyces sp. NPDC003393]
MIPCSVVQIQQTETAGRGEQRRTGRTLVACNCAWTTAWVQDGAAWTQRVRHEAAGRPGLATGWVNRAEPSRRTRASRALVFARPGRVFIQSRNGADLTDAFPDIAQAADAFGEDLVLDGELVVPFHGRLDFAELQARARRRGRIAVAVAAARPAFLITFDVLEAAGTELLHRPYRERRELLERQKPAESFSWKDSSDHAERVLPLGVMCVDSSYSGDLSPLAAA